MSQQNLSSFIWSVADLLRGDYKQSEYGRVILPFTVLRRQAGKGLAWISHQYLVLLRAPLSHNQVPKSV